MCVSVYDLDDDRVGRRRPSAGSIVHTDYIIIVSEDEQCRKGGDTLERARSRMHGRQVAAHGAHDRDFFLV